MRPGIPNKEALGDAEELSMQKMEVLEGTKNE